MFPLARSGVSLWATNCYVSITSNSTTKRFDVGRRFNSPAASMLPTSLSYVFPFLGTNTVQQPFRLLQYSFPHSSLHPPFIYHLLFFFSFNKWLENSGSSTRQSQSNRQWYIRKSVDPYGPLPGMEMQHQKDATPIRLPVLSWTPTHGNLSDITLSCTEK